MDTLLLEEAILKWLEVQKHENKWRWSTLLKKMSIMQGVFNNLGLYDRGMNQRGVRKINLLDRPLWKNAVETVKRKMLKQPPTQAKATSLEEFIKVIRSETMPDSHRRQLALTLTLAGRAQDVAQLRRKDVELKTTDNTRTIQVVYRRGKVPALTKKTVTVVGPMLEQLEDILLPLFTDTRDRWLFPLSSPTQRANRSRELNRIIQDALGPGFSCRSLRHTMLQALSGLGFQTGELRVVSGHTTDKMCATYLNMGKADMGALRSGAAMGRAIHKALATQPLPHSHSPQAPLA
jgi:integrase